MQLQNPPDLGNVIQIEAWMGRYIVLRADGTVWQTKQDDVEVPANLSDVTQVARTFHSCVALKSDGTVVCWGGLSTPPGLKDIKKIVAAGDCFMALRKNGTVVVWPDSAWTTKQAHVPANATDIVDIAGGFSSCLALKRDGTVVGWGAWVQNGKVPTPPPDLKDVVQIAACASTSIALKRDGTVETWGEPIDGQPASLNGVVMIAASYGHVVALKEDGTVVSWGLQTAGQSVPSSLGGVGRISADFGLSCALGTVGLDLPKTLEADGWGKGTVIVPQAPGKDGGWITLNSGDPYTRVPPRVFVKAGHHTATFNVEALAPVKDSFAKITATYGPGSCTSDIQIHGTGPVIELDHERIVGGSSDTLVGRIRFSRPPTKDTVVALTSDSALLKVPETVRVPAKARYTEFSIQHFRSAYNKTVNLKLSQSDEQIGTTNLVVIAPKATPSIPTATAVNDPHFQGIVTLNAPFATDTKVALSSDDTKLVQLPATITIPAGQTVKKFHIGLGSTTVWKDVAITATVDKQSLSTKLRVLPIPPLEALIPVYAYGNSSGSVGVRLQDAGFPEPKFKVVCAISSDNPNIEFPTGSLTIGKYGVGSATFGVKDISVPVTANITVQCGDTVIVKPISLRPTSIDEVKLYAEASKGGNMVRGKIVLMSRPNIDTDWALKSSSPSLVVPPTLTIPAHRNTFDFAFQSQAVSKTTKVTITIKRKSVSYSFVVTLKP